MKGEHENAGGAGLTNLCRWRSLLWIVLLAELLALILVLAPGTTGLPFLAEVVMVSAFVQGGGSISVFVLCLLRGYLFSCSLHQVALIVYGVVAGVTLLLSGLLLFMASWQIADLSFPAQCRFVLSNVAIAVLVTSVALRYAYVQRRVQQRNKTEIQARIQALQARIRPHFLFNSMNTIASLIRRDPQAAEQAVEDLADLFRVALEQKDRVTLAEELEVTRRYLNIESLRLGNRLKVDWRLDLALPLDSMMPGLILQPLVENAIYHGIEPATDGGIVKVEVWGGNSAIAFAVTNPLAEGARRWSKRGSHIAQHNVRERLALAYDEPEPLQISKSKGEYRVFFCIPLRRGV